VFLLEEILAIGNKMFIISHPEARGEGYDFFYNALIEMSGLWWAA
jgi:hypothetical protein